MIVDLQAYRQAKQKPAEVSTLTIFKDALYDVLYDWQTAVETDQLCKLMNSLLPRSVPKFRLVHNLNAIAKVEQALDMSVVIYYPTISDLNPTGWIAGFKHGGKLWYTPEMATETYARLLNILLFLRTQEIERQVAP